MSKKRVVRKLPKPAVSKKPSRRRLAAETVETSLARAEACTIVLQIILATLKPPVWQRLREKAREDARMIGRATISEEVDCLFPILYDELG